MAIACPCWWFICILVLAGSGSAVRADVLVLDVCMKQCNEADLKAIGNIRRVIQTEMRNPYHIASPEAVLQRFGRNAPLPAVQDPLLTTETLESHLRDGIDKWSTAHINQPRENEEAVKILRGALTEAMDNPAVAFSHPRLRPLIQHAYIGMAICLLRLKRLAEAKSAIADMVRATPETSILDLAGTDADRVFQLSRNDLLARGAGSLAVQVDDPNVMFYLNITGQPHKGIFAADTMLAGVYQVFAVDTAKRSRRFYVEVPPGGHAVLDIVWHRDSQFETPSVRQPRIGFTFSTFAERQSEAEYAGHFATLVAGALVVVVGRITWDGKDAMIGAHYGPIDTVPSHIGVIGGIELASARELATFLLTNKPAPHVVVLDAVPWAHPSSASTLAEDNASGGLARWTIVGGIVAIAGGVGLYAIDNSSRRTAPYGVVAGVAGIASLGVGMGSWLQRSMAPRSGLMVSVGASTMVGWTGRF